MNSPQSAILSESGPFALYALFKVIGDPALVNARCKAVHELIAEINDAQRAAELRAAVSFSSTYWRYTDLESPDSFGDFPTLGQGDLTAPSTNCDFLLHAHSNRHDLNFFLLREFLAPIASEVQMLDETYGFRYLDSRDMIGFIDGTENPKTREQRAQTAIIRDGECQGGSFVMTQRYVHRLAAWEKLSVDGQEQTVGRTKADSVELDDVPANSHVGRVDIKENGIGLKIVRHSLPYGSVCGDHGLLFIAYCNRQHHFIEMLRRMYGETDGTSDALLRYTQAVTGAFLYAPSMEQLSRV